MPHPYSAFNSRTARIRRTAASPLLTTAIRFGNVTVDRSDTRSVYDRGSGPRTESAAALSTNTDAQAGREPHLFQRDAEVGPVIAAFLRWLEMTAFNEA